MTSTPVASLMDTGSKIFAGVSVCMAIIIVLAFVIDSKYEPGEDNEIIDICVEHGGGKHNHVTLKIVIRGTVLQVPAETGVSSDCMRGIHTHDTDETAGLHIEAPVAMEARLEHFFEIWDQPLTETALVDATVQEGESVTLKVDGVLVEDFQNHVLEDGQFLELRLE